MITLRRWVAEQLFRLALWIDVPLEPSEATPDPLLTRARELVREADTKWPAGHEEAKRHAVYAQLITEFGQDNKRRYGRAIEDALEQETP